MVISLWRRSKPRALYHKPGKTSCVYRDGRSGDPLIRVDNTLIRGSVQVIKTEAVAEPSAVENTNENTFMRFLSGAEFALYADTNGNKEFDSGISRSESSPKRTAATIRRKTCWKAVISSRKARPRRAISKMKKPITLPSPRTDRPP